MDDIEMAQTKAVVREAVAQALEPYILRTKPVAAPPTSPRKEEEDYCVFCCKARHEVLRLIAAPRLVFICDECVAFFATYLQEGPPVRPEAPSPLSPEKALLSKLIALLQGFLDSPNAALQTWARAVIESKPSL